MGIPSLRRRASDAVELMDDLDCDQERLDRTYANFRFVNAVVSGWRGIYRREIRPVLSTTVEHTLLDIGAGGGDVARLLARWAARDGLRLAVTGIDPDARAHAYATGLPPLAGLTFRRALSSELVAEGARFDFVVSNHVLHHLSAAQLGGLLADSERLAVGRVLHGDIERSRFAYLGFGLGTWPFFRRSFIRDDGLTSIRRSFTAAELRAVAPPGWRVTRERPSRLVLRWAPPATPEPPRSTPSDARASTPSASSLSSLSSAPLPSLQSSPSSAPSASSRSTFSVETAPHTGRVRPKRSISAGEAGEAAAEAAGEAGDAGSEARLRDVIIVGGGPVGILLAGLLAVRGLAVEVLEQRREPSLRSRAIGIHPPSLAALRRLDVADTIMERAVRIGSGEVRSDGLVLGRLTFAANADRYQRVISLPQYETEAVLRARFEALRPGGYREGLAVTGIRDCGDRVEVYARAGARGADAGSAADADAAAAADGAGIAAADGAGAGAGAGAGVAVGSDGQDGSDGSRLVGTARYVVAADGARSVVRALVGIRFTARSGGETYLMSDYPDAGESADAAVLYFERGGVVESFPLPGGRRRWVAMTDRPRPDTTSLELANIVGARTGVSLPASNAPVSAFTVRQGLAERLVRGRVVLVGDAAHQISPIGGQGMNLGWLDALRLAPALERAIREPDAAASVLGDYDRRRRRSARMAARQAGFNMLMGQPARGPRLRLRNALVRVLAVPPASVVLARAFTMRWL